MKIKDLIELLEEENPKAKVIFEFEDRELTIDELGIESSDSLVVIKLLEK
jgi:translation initiation factor IF-3